MTEASVQAALHWLAANQSEDGRWDCSRHGGGRETKTLGHDRGGAGGEADTAVTGLAVWPSSARATRSGTASIPPRSAAAWSSWPAVKRPTASWPARRAVRPHVLPRHGDAGAGRSVRLTGDPGLRPFLERALAYTVRSQHPVTGGWRYQPGDEGDTSQLGWQLMSLHNAELAGVPIPAGREPG